MISKCDIRPGTRISCYIAGIKCPDCMFQVQEKVVFICQNYRSGQKCKDSLGYLYSWVIGRTDSLENQTVQIFFQRVGVTNVNIIKNDWDEVGNI